MPELFGEAALYYETGDASDLARKIRTILAASADEHRGRREAAQARAANFTWLATAHDTIKQLTVAADMEK